MPQSAYIHIPFCRRKCGYCAFVSYNMPEKHAAFIEKLLAEIKSKYKGELLKTVYLGGGTPSLLEISQVKKILNCLNFDENTEITLEANPDSVNFEYLKALKQCGINRLSLGVQSFDDKILKIANRLHSAGQAVLAYKNARKAGFDNINLDFIYGLPEQSTEGVKNDLKTAVSLNPEHISLYGLKIEERTPFSKQKFTNIADDDAQAEMYLAAIEILADFEHYEFSNFAREGKFSRHNLNYWENEEYYGFGAAAHGYIDGVRYSNFANLESYLKTPQKPENQHKITPAERLEEEIFLGFRRCAGIDSEKINRKFSINFDEKYSKILKKYEKTGHLARTEKGWRLTTQGILVSNEILCEFLA